MLEIVRVALPTLVSVTVTGVLALPTPCVAKSMLVVLKEKPGVGAGTIPVLPAPPQDMDHKAMATQAVAKIATLPRSRGCALPSIPSYSSARVTSRKPWFQAPPTRAHTKGKSAGTPSHIVNTKDSRIGHIQTANFLRVFRFPHVQVTLSRCPSHPATSEGYDRHPIRVMTSRRCVNVVITGVLVLWHCRGFTRSNGLEPGTWCPQRRRYTQNAGAPIIGRDIKLRC